jgi:peptide/nickel transport system ATP-binding protein
MPELLSIRNLSITFEGRARGHVVRAVDAVSFEVPAGRTVALVGESGSGKSSIGNAIVGLVPVTDGSILLRGEEIASRRRMVDRRTVSRHAQMVFQDPYGSLNPARTIAQTLVEPLLGRSQARRGEWRGIVQRALDDVGLPPEALDRYPASFSGGQRQRIAIARALVVAPEIIVCDEPVSKLDVSIQAQILNLLGELQEQRGVAYLFISHDVAVVRHIAHEVVVMYRGQVMETGPARVVCNAPAHPYTKVLLAAAPVPDPEEQRRRRGARRNWPGGTVDAEPGEAGCPFRTRCSLAIDRCRLERPQLRPSGLGSSAACHRLEDAVATLV